MMDYLAWERQPQDLGVLHETTDNSAYVSENRRNDRKHQERESSPIVSIRRARVSKSLKAFYNHPVYGPIRREEVSRRVQKRIRDGGPALRAKVSEARRQRFANPDLGPETRDKMSAAQMRILNHPVDGPARRDQLSTAQKKIREDPVRAAEIQARRLVTIRPTSNRRVRTKWRHALRHPSFLAFREKVNLMAPEGNGHRQHDRLRYIDAIDKAGTTDQKRKCLRNIITSGKSAIIPHFYRKGSCEDGMRFPGDGGPDPQVETDHESTEEEVSQEISQLVDQYSPKARPKRPRDPEKRRLASRKWAQKERKANPDRLAKRKAKAFLFHEAVKTSTFGSGLLANALRRQWPIRPKFQPVITQLEKINVGDEAGSSLLLLDTEFFSFNRKVFEVALVELESGRVCVEARVDHGCAAEDILSASDGKMPGLTSLAIGQGTLRSVYGTIDPRESPGKMTPTQIAEEIIKAGITSESIILVWHLSTMDLDLLRELLESANYPNILPPKENCIPVLQDFWTALRGDKKSSQRLCCKLDVLFPILFAGHQLVGKNHRALPDAMMLRHMVLLLLQLQKPQWTRDLSSFPRTTQSMVQYGQLPQTELQKWLECCVGGNGEQPVRWGGKVA